jgi:hypothetical protein
MTGPIDTVSVTTRTTTMKSWPSNRPANISTQNTVVGATVHALRCPALIRNAKRTDGTRPMSAWSKDWVKAFATPVGLSVRVVPGQRDTEYDITSDSLLSEVIPRGPVLPGQIGTFWLNQTTRWPYAPQLEVYSDQVARTKVLNKLGQKKWDIGVTALELKQTAGLVTDLSVSMVRQVEKMINFRKKSAGQLRRFMRDVRRQGSFSQAAKNVGLTDINLLNDLRATWMQYQFGIKPALMDALGS